jgi:hypothetical protein
MSAHTLGNIVSVTAVINMMTVRNFAVKTLYSGALVRQLTIPTERPPLVGEVNANFSG